jgi:nitrate reductase delta subunit
VNVAPFRGPPRLGAFNRSPERRDTVERLQTWTRERFGLAEGTTVFVTELACTIPGCPPLETVIAFWLDDGQRRHFKIFKPIDRVVPEDLPPAWLRDALCAEPDDGLACC